MLHPRATLYLRIRNHVFWLANNVLTQGKSAESLNISKLVIIVGRYFPSALSAVMFLNNTLRIETPLLLFNLASHSLMRPLRDRLPPSAAISMVTLVGF